MSGLVFWVSDPEDTSQSTVKILFWKVMPSLGSELVLEASGGFREAKILN